MLIRRIELKNTRSSDEEIVTGTKNKVEVWWAYTYADQLEAFEEDIYTATAEEEDSPYSAFPLMGTPHVKDFTLSLRRKSMKQGVPTEGGGTDFSIWEVTLTFERPGNTEENSDRNTEDFTSLPWLREAVISMNSVSYEKEAIHEVRGTINPRTGERVNKPILSSNGVRPTVPPIRYESGLIIRFQKNFLNLNVSQKVMPYLNCVNSEPIWGAERGQLLLKTFNADIVPYSETGRIRRYVQTVWEFEYKVGQLYKVSDIPVSSGSTIDLPPAFGSEITRDEYDSHAYVMLASGTRRVLNKCEKRKLKDKFEKETPKNDCDIPYYYKYDETTEILGADRKPITEEVPLDMYGLPVDPEQLPKLAYYMTWMTAETKNFNDLNIYPNIDLGL